MRGSEIAVGWWADLNRLLQDAGQPDVGLRLALVAAWMSPANAAHWIVTLREMAGPDYGSPEP